MRLVALTGGIGSGKSSVSERLVARGARLIDADVIVAELQRPDQPVFVAMVERWGNKIVNAEGELDRPEVAKIVFADSDELKALNKIVHPEVGIEMQRRIDAAADTTDVVILDIPLLTKDNLRGASATIVVDCPADIAIDRLVAHRNFEVDDAKARIAAQAKRHVRLTMADWIVDNSGSIAALDEQVEQCWQWLESLPQTDLPKTDGPDETQVENKQVENKGETK